MKKLTDNELKELGLKKYIMKPSTKFMGGIEVKKDMKFEDSEIVDDFDKERDAERKIIIEQVFENLTLTTKTTTYLRIKDIYEDTQERKTTQKIEEGTLLVFVNEQGWGVTNEPIYEIEKGIKDLELVRGSKNKKEV